MTVYKEFNFGNKNNPFGNLIGIIFLILFFVALFFIAKGIFTILSWVAPVLLILTLIIDHKVVLDFGKWIVKLFKQNVLTGILAVLLTVIGFPIAAGFLFFRAMVRRRLRSLGHELDREESYTKYEEVEEDTDFLELPEMEKPQRDKTSEYDDLFS